MKNKFIILISCLLFSFSVYSQNLKTIKHYYGFTGKLAEVYTVISGTATKHGNYKSYDEYGFLFENLNYKNNRFDGTCIAYRSVADANGKQLIKYTRNYVNGQQHGKQYYYYNVQAGSNSALEDYSVYDNGTMISQTAYYPEGNKKSFKETTPTSYTNFSWYGNSNKKSEEYKKIIDGEVVENGTTYSAEGQILRTYKADQKGNKTINEYYDNGQSKYVEKLIRNNGRVTTYHQNGKIKEVYSVVDGAINEVTGFNEKGDKILFKEVISHNNTIETKYNSDGSTEIVYHNDGQESTKHYNKEGKITFEKDENDNKKKYTYSDDDYIARVIGDEDLGFRTDTLMRFNNDNILLEKENVRYSNNKVVEVEYEEYSLTGKVIKRGRDDEYEKQFIKYNEQGNKIEELETSGDHYVFYDNGNYKSVQFELHRNMGKYAECTIEDCITYVDFYDNKAIKTVGRLDKISEIRQGLWYHYNSDGKLVEVEENGQKNKKIKGSHRRSGKSLINEVKLALNIEEVNKEGKFISVINQVLFD